MMKKIAAAIAAALLVMAAAAGFYYRAIQKDHAAKIEEARRIALEETALVRVDDVTRFAGDAVWYVVSGADEEERPLFVWIGEDGVTVQAADEGMSREEAAARTLERQADAAILRIVPGKLDGEPVWEVFYERDGEGGLRRYYDYYRMRDGALLDTWRLFTR